MTLSLNRFKSFLDQCNFKILEYFLYLLLSIHFNIAMLLFISGNNGGCLCLECLYSLLYCLGIIINSSGCFTSIDQSINHCLLRTIEKNAVLNVNLISNLLLPSINILYVSGETIKKINTIPSTRFDIFLHQSD